MKAKSRKQVIAPAKAVVSVDALKQHLRIDLDDERDLLKGFIGAATRVCERIVGRQFVTATWEARVAAFPGGDRVELWPAPLVGVTSVAYYDADNTLRTLDADAYHVVTIDEPGRIERTADASWPSTYPRPDAVIITYTAGYGEDPTNIPEDYRNAVRVLAGHYYKHRDEGPTTVPNAVYALLGDCCRWG